MATYLLLDETPNSKHMTTLFELKAWKRVYYQNK